VDLKTPTPWPDGPSQRSSGELGSTLTPQNLGRLMEEKDCTHLFVDLDDTLLDCDSLPAFCLFLLGRHWHQPIFHRRISLPLLLAGSRLQNPAAFKPSLVRFFDRWMQQDLQEMGRAFAKRLLRRVRPPLAHLLEQTRQRGGQVVLATASLDLYCAPLATELEINALLATEVDYQEGICTGRLATPNCKGKAKLERLEKYCRLNGIQPERACFLSDHESDAPCFDFVGLPAVVCPTPKLRAFAQHRKIPELTV